MTHRRCRDFDNTGAPIGRGCSKQNCAFVHPTQPEWATAPVYRFDKSRGPPGRGGARKVNYHDRDRPERPRHNPAPSNAADDTQWDASSWGAPPSIPSRSKPVRSRSPSSQTKINSGSQVTTAPVSEGWGWGGGWGSTDNNSSVGSGWGDAGNDGSRGTSINNGWGVQSVSSKNSSVHNGWGFSDSSTKTSSGSGSGWGVELVQSSSDSKIFSTSGWDSSPKIPDTVPSSGTSPFTRDKKAALAGWGSQPKDPTSKTSWGASSPVIESPGARISSGWGQADTPLSWNNNVTGPGSKSVSKPPLSPDVTKDLPSANSPASAINDSNQKTSFNGQPGSHKADVGPRASKHRFMDVNQSPHSPIKRALNSVNKKTRTNSSPSFPPAGSYILDHPSPNHPLRIETNVSDPSALNTDNERESAFALQTPNTAFPFTPTVAMDPMTRSQAFQRLIKDLVPAIRYDYEVRHLEEKNKAWINAQKSSEYAKASPKVAHILDKQRRDFKQGLVEKQGKLRGRLKALSMLPSFEDPMFKPEFDIQTLEHYITQLETWIEEAKHYQKSNAPELTPAQATTTQSTTTSQIPSNPHKSARFQKIRETITRLDQIRGRIADGVDFKEWIQLPDSPQEQALNKKLSTSLQPLIAGRDSLKSLDEAATSAGTKLGGQVVLAADLMEKGAKLDAEIDSINAELERRESIRVKAENSLRTYEEWHQEDTARIDELERKLQQIRSLPRPTPPIDIKSYEPILRKIVTDQVCPDIQDILDAVRDNASKCHQTFVDDVNNRLQQTLDTTNNLYTRAREATNLQNITNISNATH